MRTERISGSFTPECRELVRMFDVPSSRWQTGSTPAASRSMPTLAARMRSRANSMGVRPRRSTASRDAAASTNRRTRSSVW
eukprot:6529209-Prymnesium_polylepis.2